MPSWSGTRIPQFACSSGLHECAPPIAGARTPLVRLKDKVVVITGAASGMGRSIAIRFAAEGARLIVGDRHAQRLGEVVAQIRGGGASIVSEVGDITDQSTAESLVDLAVSSHGRIDVLVNNAGIMDHFQGVGELSNEVWRSVLATNLDGPMFTTRRALGPMRKQGGGSIVNIASLSSFSGASAGVAYTASKHALLGLTRNTAWRYAKEGIRCNAICPGAVKTNIEESMPQAKLDPQGMARAVEFFSLGHAYLDPAEIASLALFLASDEALYINGAVVSADGGLCAT
jgi:NAD(P)-dependent dehydrogenase (short-subunit alcohol dehydrogenase family)